MHIDERPFPLCYHLIDVEVPAAGQYPMHVLKVRISELPDSDYAKSRTAVSVIPGQPGHG